MVEYLLDTNVVSELNKPRPHPRVLVWMEAHQNEAMYISALTLGEIRKGIAMLEARNSAHAHPIAEWAASLRHRFSNRILPVEHTIAEVWGLMMARQDAHAIDTLIAATARVHHMVMVTRNVKLISAHDVPLINPFEELP